MGLHQRHTHGRVFHGEEAREQLRIRKRDSHGNDPRMHVPEGFEQKQVEDNSDDSGTAYSVVYVTLPQTFEGPAVYSTMTDDFRPEMTAVATPTNNPQDGAPDFFSGEPTSEPTSEPAVQETSGATITASQSNNRAAMTTFATEPSAAASRMAGSPLQGTHSATSAPNMSQQNVGSSEMTGSAKAGLAFGIIFAIAAACGIIWFCWRRKRTIKQSDIIDEKHGSFADVGARRAEAAGVGTGSQSPPTAGYGAAAGLGAAGTGAGATVVYNKRDSSMTEKAPTSLRSTQTASTAPRLSLRPVTQMFMPNLNDNRKSSTGLNASSAEKSGSVWERQPQSAGQDPFADTSSALSEKDSRPHSPPSDPFQDGRKSDDTHNDSAVAVGAAANGPKHQQKASWEGSEPSTPKSAHFGTAAAVPVTGPNGQPPRQPNNVHRVQLDFKPSMDDELELRSGQLVRLLHEYDDGWALCIRMDRSQQGVAPRTCLSKLPVKPRPQGPPPNGRPGPPPQGARRPSNPPAPQGMPGAMMPRPLTPTQGPRASSPTQPRVSGESSGSQKSVPARKPVPGQAM